MSWQKEIERLAKILDPQYLRKEQAYNIGHLWTYLKPKRILEIGTFKGTGACYLAAMCKEYDGHVTTIDLPWTEKHSNELDVLVEEQMEKSGITNVTVVRREDGSEGWLKDHIKSKEPPLDFIYLDGGHTWLNTAAQVIMSMATLKIGGWLVMDDILVPKWPDVGLVWQNLIPLLGTNDKRQYIRDGQGFVMRTANR